VSSPREERAVVVKDEDSEWLCSTTPKGFLTRVQDIWSTKRPLCQSFGVEAIGKTNFPGGKVSDSEGVSPTVCSLSKSDRHRYQDLQSAPSIGSLLLLLDC
jgi:hypothetical protein